MSEPSETADGKSVDAATQAALAQADRLNVIAARLRDGDARHYTPDGIKYCNWIDYVRMAHVVWAEAVRQTQSGRLRPGDAPGPVQVPGCPGPQR